MLDWWASGNCLKNIFLCCNKSLTNVKCIKICFMGLFKNDVIWEIFWDILSEKNLLDDLKYISCMGILSYPHKLKLLSNIFCKVVTSNFWAQKNYLQHLIVEEDFCADEKSSDSKDSYKMLSRFFCNLILW